MKRIIPYFFTLAVSFMAAASCETGFLDRYPSSSLSSGTMFKSETTAETVVIGAYNQLRYGLGTMWATSLDCFADVFDPDIDRVGTSYQLLNASATSSVAMFDSFWKNYYEGISRANDVINNFNQVPASNELKEKRIAECKFLRALWYYRLNALWRGVPIYKENLAPDQYNKSRASEKEVWDFIISDLTDCIECGSLPDRYETSSSDYGRVTKGAAYALRGKVHLWLKEWSEAESDFRKVSECGYSLFSGSYGDLFTEANERCNEMIFSVQMENIPDYGNALSYNCGNHCTAGTGQNAYTVSTKYVDSFTYVDGRPFNWDDIIPGFSGLPSNKRRVYFLRDGLTEAEITAQGALEADMSQYLPSGNEERIKAAYQGRDPRLEAIAITPYSEYVGGVEGSPQTYTYRYPFRSKNSPALDLETATPSNLIYPVRKFVSTGVDCINVTYNPTDVPVIRYADILLNLAEALNEQDRLSDAVSCVNQVRQRAGVALLNDNSYTTVTTKEEMRTRIMNERKWELAGEQVLYYDELRWGTIFQDKYSDGNGIMQAWGSTILEYSAAGDHYAVWPVPQGEQERNNNIRQNDGWIM